jgi:hypothetical protein
VGHHQLELEIETPQQMPIRHEGQAGLTPKGAVGPWYLQRLIDLLGMKVNWKSCLGL